jgi:serine/threonine-protein kinase
MSRSASEQPRAIWCCATCGAIYHKDFPRCPADGSEVVMTERDPLIGSMIGHYTIGRLLGEGGMGRVYLAHHANLPNKRYAFKVLLGDHSASTAMRTRFTREAERASQLDHPNVVKVVDFGQTRHGLLYIVMDYVEGPSLVSLYADAPMPPARAIALTRQICKGLVYAHTAGLVHRDLKPENILVSSGPDGEVPRIVDFGLAVSLDQSDARLTESGMTMGTPAFASPEQISGKPIDHRADLYALGLSMFEMLTGGKAPFEGHAMEIVSARTTRDAPRIRERMPELAIPPELEEIVARLTRRRPVDRYASAREVIDALDGVRLGPEARMPTEPIAVVTRRWPRVATRLSAVAVVAALAVVAWSLHGSGGDSPSPPVARVESAPVVVAEAPAPPSEPAPAAASAVEPPAPPVVTPAKHRRHTPPVKREREHEREPHERAARPAVHVEAAPAAAAPAPVQVASPPAPPRALRARIDGVEVSGSLPRGEVERAIERRWSAIERCVPASPGIVVASFTIGEARRARDVHTAGPAAQANACVAAAFADVRTEAAPDVGDVEVTVRIAFVVNL